MLDTKEDQSITLLTMFEDDKVTNQPICKDKIEHQDKKSNKSDALKDKARTGDSINKLPSNVEDEIPEHKKGKTWDELEELLDSFQNRIRNCSIVCKNKKNMKTND